MSRKSSSSAMSLDSSSSSSSSISSPPTPSLLDDDDHQHHQQNVANNKQTLQQFHPPNLPLPQLPAANQQQHHEKQRTEVDANDANQQAAENNIEVYKTEEQRQEAEKRVAKLIDEQRAARNSAYQNWVSHIYL